jgi:hypothetical protein
VIVSDRYRWPIRAGYFTDRQTSTAADGRPPRFNGATVGMGFGVGPLLMDVAFVYERGDWVDTNDFDQSLRTRRVLLSLIYRDLVRR